MWMKFWLFKGLEIQAKDSNSNVNLPNALYYYTKIQLSWSYLIKDLTLVILFPLRRNVICDVMTCNVFFFERDYDFVYICVHEDACLNFWWVCYQNLLAREQTWKGKLKFEPRSKKKYLITKLLIMSIGSFSRRGRV